MGTTRSKKGRLRLHPLRHPGTVAARGLKGGKLGTSACLSIHLFFPLCAFTLDTIIVRWQNGHHKGVLFRSARRGSGVITSPRGERHEPLMAGHRSKAEERDSHE